MGARNWSGPLETCSNRSRLSAILAGAPVLTAPPLRSMIRAGRLRVHRIERLVRHANRRGLRVGAEHLGQHARERRSGGVRRRLVERGERERIPEHLAQPRCLSVSHQPVLDRLAGRGRDRVSCRARARAARGAAACAMRSTADPILPGQRRPVEHAGDQVQRRRQRGHSRRLRTPCRSTIVTASADWNDTLSRAPMSSRNVSVSR